MPSESNGDHVDETAAWKESDQDIFDGEQLGGAADEVNLDHDDAAWPISESIPVNGENSEDVQNDATPHDHDESANELDDTAEVRSHDEEAEFNTADDTEAKERADEANDDAVAGDDSTAVADVEIEERAGDTEATAGTLHEAELDAEPSGEVLDAEPDTDVVDAASPMDVDVPQTSDAGIAAPDVGCDSAMEVEFSTADEVTGESTSGELVADSINKDNDQESPMAGDDNSSRQSDHRTDTQMNELQDSENITSEAAALDEAEFDEVDALQSKTSRRSDLSDSSQNADESGNVDHLVEGDDFTVELQPDTSEQESAASEVDQSATESENAEKTGIESESGAVEESDKTAVDAKTADSETCTASAPDSSDTVYVYFYFFLKANFLVNPFHPFWCSSSPALEENLGHSLNCLMWARSLFCYPAISIEALKGNRSANCNQWRGIIFFSFTTGWLMDGLFLSLHSLSTVSL